MDTTHFSLLIRLKNLSDQGAWQEFDAIYRPMLMRFAQARGLNHADAEDVVQTCLTEIQQHIANFDYDPHRGRFKGWLCTLINNRVRNRIRDGRHEQPADDSAPFKIPQQRELTPEEMFEKIRLEELLRHSLRWLREQVGESEFHAFQQYALEQRPTEEVCRETGLTAAQLHKLKWRLTQKLRRKMEEITGEAADADGDAPAAE